MMYQVLSKRMSWPAGTVVDARDLAGCNIPMLVATGHLTPAPTPKKKTKWEPEPPVTDDDSADEPEEQD
jgi:hypothetical protein